MLEFGGDDKTAKKTAETQQNSSASHFKNAVSFLDTGKQNKITFYLSDSEIAVLETAMNRFSLNRRNDAMKLAIAALLDQLNVASSDTNKI